MIGGQLVIDSHEWHEQTIPKDTILMSWTKGTCMRNGGGMIKKWDLRLSSHVWFKDARSKSRIDKLLQWSCAGVRIWQYRSFPRGTVPMALVKEHPDHEYHFDSKSAQKSYLIHKFIYLWRGISSCSLLWIVGVRDGVLRPWGLAVVTNKKLVLPGKVEFAIT
jgi:hypothetical protein